MEMVSHLGGSGESEFSWVRDLKNFFTLRGGFNKQKMEIFFS